MVATMEQAVGGGISFALSNEQKAKFNRLGRQTAQSNN